MPSNINEYCGFCRGVRIFVFSSAGAGFAGYVMTHLGGNGLEVMYAAIAGAILFYSLALRRYRRTKVSK